ncbi:type ISP restriction/modification enzyme [Streptomyces resistomycificus]|uniref:DNA methyltransferase n=1 Tax=Streptomyces resistomycificus TaxID=67356 RepID=A0A0L8LZ32_9ACTN|nr:type ISP restriction/modification enzyme [Streptomyces resistomycificus]KOG43401.1 DNA methyltransferase [Streptomyces resistomycificus]KUN91537.1 DNA methyltransferase [Streptomyces resistomycificus]
MPSVTHDDAPPLADLMPWSVAPPRLGRGWPTGPDAASLRARWDALLKAEGPDRESLFEPTRSRTLRTAVGQLPGRSGSTEKLVRAAGPCPEPVRVLRAPFDEQWLIPDHRLIDAARPELWRVADEHQVFVTESPGSPGPALLATSLLPLLRPGRIRPLYRRPGGTEPNLAPGLLDHLATRLGLSLTPADLLAWTVAVARPGLAVPLTADPGLWAHGVGLGHRLLWLLRRDGDRPKLPGGRRPYVRAPLPDRPLTLRYDRDEETLYLDEGRISPVPPESWDFEVAGARVLEQWFTARTTEAEPGTLEAIRPATWPQAWTSELLELIAVLALLAELGPRQEELTVTSPITATDLRRAGVLPVPEAARRPASVLDHHEEGPEGQFALI